MTYLIALLCLIIIACAVTIYRLSGEIRELEAFLRGADARNHYLLNRNRDLNAELLTRDVVTTTHGSSVPAIVNLPAEHPQKRPKAIRGKRK